MWILNWVPLNDSWKWQANACDMRTMKKKISFSNFVHTHFRLHQYQYLFVVHIYMWYQYVGNVRMHVLWLCGLEILSAFTLLFACCACSCVTHAQFRVQSSVHVHLYGNTFIHSIIYSYVYRSKLSPICSARLLRAYFLCHPICWQRIRYRFALTLNAATNSRWMYNAFTKIKFISFKFF